MTRARGNRFLRASLGLVLAAVAGLHLQILWVRFADGSVFEPIVAGRWLTSVAVILFFAAIRRRGLPLFHGRPALILWLLVLLLHGVGLVPSAGAASLDGASGEIFLIATPLGLGVATLFWTGIALTRRSGKVPFALLPRRFLHNDSFVPGDLHLLVAAGPRAPPG